MYVYIYIEYKLMIKKRKLTNNLYFLNNNRIISQISEFYSSRKENK